MSDRIKTIVMPKWGLTMEEGTVLTWLVHEGSDVETGAELLEVETSKINNVVESPAAGSLRRQVVSEGQTVQVGTLLAVVADASISEEEIDHFVDQFNEMAAANRANSARGAPVEPKTVEAGGCVLNYESMGRGDGPPILLIHGFGGDLNNWLFTQPALAENHLTYAFDLPGHGRSSKQIGDGDVPWMTGIVVEFLNNLRLDKVHVIAHSLGAAICLNMALYEPDRVTGMTLIGPAGLGSEINMDYIDSFISAERRKQMKSVLQTLFSEKELVNRDLVDNVLKYKRLDGVAQALKRIAAGAFKDGEQSLVLRSQLKDLTVPVQVIWGKQDQVIPSTQADDLTVSIPIHLLEGAGHMVHMEKAARVNELIVDFIAT